MATKREIQEAVANAGWWLAVARRLVNEPGRTWETERGAARLQRAVDNLETWAWKIGERAEVN